jgi:hypothetical protein
MFASHRFTEFAGTALIAGSLGLAAVARPALPVPSARRMTRS